MITKVNANEIQAADAPVKTQPIVPVPGSIQEKRAILRELSLALKPFVDSGEFSSLNEAIIQCTCKNLVHQEFKSRKQWLEDGMQVRQGAEPFMIWGKPRKSKDDDRTYFPI